MPTRADRIRRIGSRFCGSTNERRARSTISISDQNYLAYAIDRANKLGFSGGEIHRDAIARLQLRLFTSDPDYPRAAAAPFLVGVGTPRPGRLQLFQSMADVWKATAGNERPFVGYYGPAARLSLMIAVENGWSGARDAYDYLWSFIGRPASRGKLPDLMQRAGWALDFDTAAAAPIVALDPATGIIDPAATDPTVASSLSSTAQGTHTMMTAAISTAVTSAVAPFTLPEGIPDFSQDTARPGVQSVQNGNWSNPATWQGGQVPTANHVVRILAGHTVTITDTSAVAYTVAIDGKLTFATTANTRLKATNIEVMAGNMGTGTPGVLELGTTASPVARRRDRRDHHCEFAARRQRFGPGPGTAPGSSSWVSFRCTAAPRTPTFMRLATEPRAGNTTLALVAGGQRLACGDRLVLPDTRHIKESEVTGGGWINAVNQWEERTVQAISADRMTLTLNAALQYDHLGARDLNGVLDFLPHVGNLTRNVIVRTRDHFGTRGHMLATHKANVDIRYAAVQGSGTYDISAPEHHHEPHRPLSDPHASSERAAAHAGQRLPVHAGR